MIIYSKFFTLFLVIIALVLASLFSFLETATVAISKHRLESLKNEAIWAKYAFLLKQNLEKVLIFSLFGNSLFNALFTTLTTVLILDLISGFMIKGLLLPITTLIIAFFIIIFSEAVPKIIAAKSPINTLKIISLPLYYVFIVCRPIIWFINKIVYVIAWIFISSSEDSMSLEEIKAIIADKNSPFKDKHRSILLKSMNLEKLRVKEVLIPLRVVEAIDINGDLQLTYKKIYTSHHTRMIVYSDQIDNIIGYIHVKDVLSLEQNKFNTEELNKIVRPIDFISDFVPIMKQINLAGRFKKRIFVVINEYGDTLGITCLEDMLEMVFGNFTTEAPGQKTLAIKNAENQIIADGTMLIRELNDLYNLNITATEDAMTINGLVLKFLHGIPNVGVCFKLDNLIFEIISIGDYWVERVKITII
jgi:Mg2+/Co2+ transporter CorB